MSSHPHLPGTNVSDIVSHLLERHMMWFGQSSENNQKEIEEYTKLAKAMVAEAVADGRKVPIEGSLITISQLFAESNEAIKFVLSENSKITQTADNIFISQDPEDEDDEPNCISISRNNLLILVIHNKEIMASDVGVSLIKDGQEMKICQGENLEKMIEATIQHAPTTVSKSISRTKTQAPAMHHVPPFPTFKLSPQQLPVPQPRPIPEPPPSLDESEEDSENN